MLIIKIKKSENPTIWYAGLVGKVFTNVIDTGTSYKLSGADPLVNTVRYEDAERITVADPVLLPKYLTKGTESKEELAALCTKYQAFIETRRVIPMSNTIIT